MLALPKHKKKEGNATVYNTLRWGQIYEEKLVQNTGEWQEIKEKQEKELNEISFLFLLTLPRVVGIYLQASTPNPLHRHTGLTGRHATAGPLF